MSEALKKPDIKDLVRFSNSGALNFLRISTRVIALPSLAIYPTSACNYDCLMCDCGRIGTLDDQMTTAWYESIRPWLPSIMYGLPRHRWDWPRRIPIPTG